MVGDRSRIFGDLVHRQLDPTLRWDAPEAAERAPTIEAGAFVGWGATVVGPATVGAGAYLCAGATVTRDVPPGVIAHGVNRFVSAERWKGDLAMSPFLRQTARVISLFRRQPWRPCPLPA